MRTGYDIKDVIDVLGLLAVLGAVAVLWIAMGIFDKRRKTERFLQELEAERERRHVSASRDAGAKRRIA
jgi:hypothetical protein